jgi:hypothetical protein
MPVISPAATCANRGDALAAIDHAARKDRRLTHTRLTRMGPPDSHEAHQLYLGYNQDSNHP